MTKLRNLYKFTLENGTEFERELIDGIMLEEENGNKYVISKAELISSVEELMEQQDESIAQLVSDYKDGMDLEPEVKDFVEGYLEKTEVGG